MTLIDRLNGTPVKVLYEVLKALNGGRLGFDEGRHPLGKKGPLVAHLSTLDAARVTGALDALTGATPVAEPAAPAPIEHWRAPPVAEPATPAPIEHWRAPPVEPAPVGDAPVSVDAEAQRILSLPFNQIHGAVQDLIARAHRPAEIRIEERIVREVVDRPVDRIVYADRATKVDAATGRLSPQSLGLRPCAEVFGVAVPRADGSDTLVEVFDCATDAPDQHYRFDARTLRLFLSALKNGRWAWLFGPPGTGKTEFLRNVAARLGRPFFRVSFDGALERYELIGGERLRNGTTEWLEGVLTQALCTPHAIVALDEVSFGRPEHLSAMHGVLEPAGAMTIPETGKVIARAPGVYIAATDNTNGCGDLTGAFAGTRPMNRAFINRFGLFVQFDYLDAVTEAALLTDRTGIPPAAARMLCDFAAKARMTVAAGDLSEAPSLRIMVPLAETILDGVSFDDAFDAVATNRLEPMSAEALKQIANAVIDSAALRAALVA
jgi:nitric oxide reductase NorQ protein